MKRLLALLLCLVMCVSLIPAAAAEDVEIVDIDPVEVEIPDDPSDGETIDIVDPEAAPEEPDDPSVGPGTAGLTSTVASGSCGNGVDWQIEETNGVYSLFIYGEGAMYDYIDSDETPWYPYRDSLQIAMISSGVTRVGNCAFRNFRQLRTVSVAGDVGQLAFGGCSSLEAVYFAGNDVTRFEYGAFDSCTSLESIALPDTLEEIGEAAFWMSGLREIEIPDSVTQIGSYTFGYCEYLNSVTVGAGMNYIAPYMFKDCTALMYFSTPGWISTIGTGAFMNCSGLMMAGLYGVCEVNKEAFLNCTSLGRVEFSYVLDRIGESAFSGCEGLQTVVFQGNPPTFELNCFSGVYGTAYFPSEYGSSWYSADLSNTGGLVFHELVRPRIVTQPTSITAPLGESVAFYVEAEGSELSYMWFEHVPGNDYWSSCDYDSVLELTVSEETAGNEYYCEIWNELDTVRSDIVTLTAETKPVITSQPQSVSIGEGKTATFTVEALNAESYQWQYRKSSSGSWNNSTSAGAKTSSFDVTAESYRNGYQYRCKVSNADGYVYSKAATLTVISKPVITAQPQSVSSGAGKTVTFTVTATDAESYQWQYRKSSSGTWNNSTASSAKTSTFSVTAESYRSGYQYRCKVSNAAGYVYSSAATLTVVEKPVILTQPQSTAICAGKSVKFTVEASDAESYQWYYRTSSSGSWAKSTASSATTPTLSYTGVSVGHNGYQYRCKVSNAAGYTYTKAATLTVTLAPVITTQPTDLTINAGEDARFTVKASGALSYQWQWRKSSSDSWKDCTVSTGTKATLVYTNLSAEKSGRQYRCRVANDKAYTYSDIVTLTVVDKPVISTQPQNLIVSAGSTVKFTVKATGAESYQWYWRKSSSDSWQKATVSTATKATLTYTNISAAKSGYQYRCKVSNSVGYVYTKAATLTVSPNQCGDNLLWQISSAGTLTISGSGDMYSFGSKDSIPWIDFKDKIKSVKIGSGVTEIGNYAFCECSKVKTVTIPGSVTYIGVNAFSGCASLTSVTIPDSVTYIGMYAFCGCTAMTNVSIGKGVEVLDFGVFDRCDGMIAYEVDSANTSYSSKDGALFTYGNISLIKYPAKKTGAYSIPGTVKSIATFAFENCTGLTSVTFPSSVNSIGQSIFSGCSSLASITVASGNTSFSSKDGVLFNKDKTELIMFPYAKTGAYTVPSSVTDIRYLAFYRSGVTSVTIPAGVTGIGSGAFEECFALNSITVNSGNAYYSSKNGVLFNKDKTELIAFPCNKDGAYTVPSSVTMIAEDSFRSCSKLTSVTIPVSVKTIRWGAFSGCTGLTDVYYKGTKTQWGKIDVGIDNEPLLDAAIHYNA